MADDDERKGERTAVRSGVLILVVVTLVVALAVITSIAFNGTLNRDAVGSLIGPGNLADGVKVNGTVTNVDPLKNQLTIRLALAPTGTFDLDHSGTPSRSITMYYSSVDGTKKATFEAGQPLSTTDVAVALKEVADPLQPQVASPVQGSYPWDTYGADVNLRIVTPSTTETGNETGDRTSSVPTSLVVYKTAPGFTVVPASSKVAPDGNVRATFEVSRSSTAKFFSLLVTVIMWALAIGVLLITVSVIKGRLALETAQISMMAVILFAMPAALRSFQPGIPPPGVLSDFYGFFWADIVVALCLVTMLIVYIRRRAQM